jgi:hypothetical protein
MPCICNDVWHGLEKNRSVARRLASTQRLTTHLGRNHLPASGTQIPANGLVGWTRRMFDRVATLTSPRILSLGLVGLEVPQFPCLSLKLARAHRAVSSHRNGKCCWTPSITVPHASIDAGGRGPRRFYLTGGSSSRNFSPVTPYHINLQRQGGFRKAVSCSVKRSADAQNHFSPALS